MPKEVFDKHYRFLPQPSLLTFEEITRIARIFTGHGVRKLRLTGGEPLLRKHIEVLIAQLAELRTPEGQPLDLTLTTNASLLGRKAQALKEAGLQRITISLDGLDDATFKRMNDVDFPVTDVLEGIATARAVGLGVDPFGQPSGIKINMVVKRGTNDDQIVPMARHFRGSGIPLRFIEYMDVGATNGWRMDDVMTAKQIVAAIDAEMPLEQCDPNYRGEVAERWRYRDGSGEIGVIASVTQAFCRDCTRARLSTEGQLFTCLFATEGHEFKSLLRGGADDAAIAQKIASIWSARGDRYSEIRTAATVPLKKVEMSYIGG